MLEVDLSGFMLGAAFSGEVGADASCFNAGFTAVDHDMDGFRVVVIAGSVLMSS